MSRKPSQLSEAEKIRAAVNTPANTFTLGDRTFEVKDLPYDDYLEFVSHVSPLIDTLINRVVMKNNASIPGIELGSSQFSTLSILQFCGDKLPLMVKIICRQTDPSITEEQIKGWSNRPLSLANIVLLQMSQNGIINDFADFFGQMVKTLTTSTLKA